MKLPAFAATATGPLKWLAVGGMGADLGFDIYGAGTATQNLVQSYRDDGDWEWQDSFNLLSYLPFIGAVGGVHRAIGSARATKGASNATSDAVASANNHVRSMSKTDVSIGGQCFVAGTEILTPEGSKNIEDIQVGDWVISDDPTTPGDIKKQQVLQTFIRQTDKLIDLYIDGEVLSTTEEHPFWVPDIGWVEAGDLEVGMRLQTDEETFVDIDRIEEREGEFEVYNFEVEEFHTYFVSDLEILVHNANCGPTNFGGVEPEDLFIREFTTSQEPLTFRAEIEINEKTLHLKDIGIFPVESRRTNATPTEIRGMLNELKEQAKSEGFEKLRITGQRASGASFNPNNINSGNKFDKTWDLTD